ncbi:MAG: fructosamine kinase family protein [Mobilicoccus sp.]|nr:fructosamine kinase family protein [Mobilicoccus sp.]
MTTLPADLVDGLDIRDIRRIGGGDIAQAYRLDTADGPVFCKTLARPTPDLFEREAAGLRALRAHAPEDLGVPEVLRESPHGLVLAWIDEGRRRDHATEEAFGRGLAGLHRQPMPAFGGISEEVTGYLGSVAVDLTPTDDWPEFYLTRRLQPLVRRAVDEGALDPRAHDLLDELASRVEELCGPSEPPALVHGDLWAGNRMIDADGRSWLIDPAAHHAHREIDLAMMQLFGGFGGRAFDAYDETYPLADGWRDRVDWYQLPPLLVHAILFGGSYGSAALAALKSYA